MSCLRNNGCSLRNHNHCNWRCNMKHNKGEKCKDNNIISSFSSYTKFGKNETEKRKNHSLTEAIIKKYGLSNELSKYLYSHLTYKEADRRWFYDTFLSDKAITPQVSVSWIRNYMIMNDIRNDKYKYHTVDTAILLFAELLSSHRHDYILNNKKFVETLEKKYMEIINNSNNDFTEAFKNAFFKDVLTHVLKLKQM